MSLHVESEKRKPTGGRPKTAAPTRVYQKMRPLGVLIWMTGAIRLYKDGDGFDALWRAWHPVTWLACVALIVPCGLLGEKLSSVVATKLSAFWLKNQDQLQFVFPWTRLSSLQPFVCRPHALEAFGDSDSNVTS